MVKSPPNINHEKNNMKTNRTKETGFATEIGMLRKTITQHATHIIVNKLTISVNPKTSHVKFNMMSSNMKKVTNKTGVAITAPHNAEPNNVSSGPFLFFFHNNASDADAITIRIINRKVIIVFSFPPNV